MYIFGKDYGFMLTVGASGEIADLCPDGDIERLGEALEGSYNQTLNVATGMIVAMSRGFETHRAFEEPGYKADPLTRDMILALSQADFKALEEEAVAAFSSSTRRSVEVVSTTKKN